MLKAGDKAPDFSLPTSDGSNISLKDLRGEKVVLFFYPKDLTSGCTKEACSFRDNLRLITKEKARIFGLSADSPDMHKKFIEKHQLNFPLLSDESTDVCKAYGVWKEKSFMGRTYMGIERTTFIIDERGIIGHVFPKVKVEGHTEDVLSRL